MKDREAIHREVANDLQRQVDAIDRQNSESEEYYEKRFEDSDKMASTASRIEVLYFPRFHQIVPSWLFKFNTLHLDVPQSIHELGAGLLIACLLHALITP